VPHYAMFTSSKHFEDPLSFVPERWTGDVRYTNDNKSVFQPFSFGPRNCVGKKYVSSVGAIGGLVANDGAAWRTMKRA